MDYVHSDKGQEGFVKLGYIPARNDVALPAGFPARDKIKVLPINAPEALKNSEKDLKSFSDIFVSKG